ncbi:MAG: PTS system fructose-specific EIIB'BC component [Paracidovorax wautersii]|uniref:protein-N(pi)-phosphohistidine--D-fructose phosphotransferase n=1 Tax=Paracidovorax wautersii TaxID=1177982 RepID=A0A7V8FPA8_9BURK|nr:MAG: PTS system fructose-specific EIIB'BC component [Paracidovorax wautersii]
MAKILAIAASQAGPAHSFVVGEALRAAAQELGHTLVLQVQSSLGAQGDFTDADRHEAAAALVVTDGAADTAELAGLAVHTITPEAVFADARGVLAQALAAAGIASPPAEAPLPAASPVAAGRRIVAITACPTGVAHTFMAAEALEQGALALGHQIKVETQGSVGAQNTLSADEIAAADLVLIAADTQVEKSRFVGKPLYSASTKAAIRDAGALINTAFAQGTPWGEAVAGPAASDVAEARTPKAPGKGPSSGPYKHLMTGVSFMLPFVVAGGLLIALAFALGGIYVYDDAHQGTLGWTLFQIGAKHAFTLMVPALAGYIAFSIADRPGIAPGMVGGLLANTLGAGFLGGIVAGFIAGYAVNALNKGIRLPRTLEGLKPVLILPLLGTAIVGLLMFFVVGKPVAFAMEALTGWLKGMQTSSAVVLGIVLGAMMAFDLGGPVNKAAYVFSTTLIASGVATPMAAAMGAGMVPPLGIALACWVFRSRFSDEEREASKAAAVLGLAFITEGAIPFVARDPLRVIPACMLGAAVTGALSMMAGIALQAPHGGIFVLAIPNAVNHVVLYAGTILAGTVVTALALGVLKKRLV